MARALPMSVAVVRHIAERVTRIRAVDPDPGRRPFESDGAPVDDARKRGHSDGVVSIDHRNCGLFWEARSSEPASLLPLEIDPHRDHP